MILAMLTVRREYAFTSLFWSPPVQSAPDNLALFLDHVGDGVTVQDPSGRMSMPTQPRPRTSGLPARPTSWPHQSPRS